MTDIPEAQIYEIAQVTAQYLETFLVQNTENDRPPCYPSGFFGENHVNHSPTKSQRMAKAPQPTQFTLL